MPENPAPPSWKLSFQLINSSRVTSSPQPPATRKNPPENVYMLPINQYYMETMGKVHSLQPFPWGLWGIKSPPKRHLLDFSTMLDKIAILKFLSSIFGKKLVRNGAWMPSNLSGHLKMALKLSFSL